MKELEIRKTFEILKTENQLVEIRIIDDKNGKKTYSGYYKNIDKLIQDIKPHNDKNIYFVLNSIKEACYSREQREVLVPTTVTTSDGDIENRDWILLDFDPKRPSKVSSSDLEKEKSAILVKKVYKFLKDIGFYTIIGADSGNGQHLLIKINLKNTPENTELVRNFINTIHTLFSDEFTDIDTSVFNAARICKLYGTISRKGRNTEERPHRESRLGNTKKIVDNPVELLRKVIDIIPPPPKKSYTNDYGEKIFNIEEFIEKHSIKIAKQIVGNNYTKYLLEECPFNENHKSPDSALFSFSNGAIAFKCFHSSCSNKTWHDFREFYEPDAYNKSFNYNNRVTTPQPKKKEEETKENKGNKFFQFKDIKTINRDAIVSIRSGIKGLDDRIIGFNKGEVTMWSGLNSSGKSSILGQIELEAINDGYKVAVWSGELTPNRFKNWIVQQAAGRNNVLPSKFNNVYYVGKGITNKIDNWLYDKFLLYNNEYGSKVKLLLSDMKEAILENGIDMIVLDNLMCLDLSYDKFNKNDVQGDFIRSLCGFAKDNNVHIHIVAHPRKSVGFLRKLDISGSADLSNAVDNVIIIHRVNRDFERLGGDFFGQSFISEYLKFGNVIEVCKNRDLGREGFLIGLYYEEESKRFLNEQYENKIYGWEDSVFQTEINYGEEKIISINKNYENLSQSSSFSEKKVVSLQDIDNENDILDFGTYKSDLPY